MTSKGKDNIRRWVDIIIHSKHKLAGQKSFARGLLSDIEAVENGISMSWSNGGVEGHVNRIKSNKRQMFGRASFELLRKKVILSKSGQSIPKFDEEPVLKRCRALNYAGVCSQVGTTHNY